MSGATRVQCRQLAALGYPSAVFDSPALAALAIRDIRAQQASDGRWIAPPGFVRGPRASLHQIAILRRYGYEGPEAVPSSIGPSILQALRTSRGHHDS